MSTGGTTKDLPTHSDRTATDSFTAVGTRLQLVMVVGPAVGMTWPLDQDVTIGRSHLCGIWLPDPFASREHARIRLGEDTSATLLDLGSRNASRVNGVEIKESQLKAGDMIGIGNSVLLLTPEPPTERQFQQLQKMESLGRLAGGVAHDFNNLLASIVNNARFLHDQDPLPDEERRECATEILVAAERGAILSRQLLDFAKVERSESKPLDLTQLINDVAEFCRKTFNKAVAVRARVQDGLVVKGDQTHLFQALINVLINAEQALPDGGAIDIDARAVGEAVAGGDLARQVEITLSDNGVGMDQATLARAFEPFFTAHKQGTGLGLSIVHSIIQRHGGQISASSTQRQGTTFSIHLPLVDAPVAPRRRPITQKTRITGVRLLLIDDDELVLRSMARMLQPMGYEVITASDGIEGVAAFEKHEIHMVLLDMIMPRLGGRETFHILRQLDPKVKVVITSGFSGPGNVDDLMAKGAVAFVPKPVDVATLQLSIAAALGD